MSHNSGCFSKVLLSLNIERKGWEHPFRFRNK